MLTDNSKILITGAHGFLGHHVVKAFEKYRNGGTNGARRDIQIITPTRGQMNLLYEDTVRTTMMHHKPDVVIHLAAQCGGIGANREKPGEFCYNNLRMGMNIIEASRQFDVKKFVGLGTVCAYPKFTPVPFKEDDLYNGYPEETNAPYGLAKRMQLDILRAYRDQYDFNGIFLVPVNMAGPYDNFNDSSSHVIPAILKKFHHAKLEDAPEVILWGTGTASREFLDVRDCADAILRATLLYNNADPINIGTGKEITIEDLAYKVKEVVGYKGVITWDPTKPDGQPRRCLDTSKAQKEFGFIASTTLDQTLIDTYNWAQENDVL